MGQLKSSRGSAIREDMGKKRVTFFIANVNQLYKVEGFENSQNSCYFDKTPIKRAENYVSAAKSGIFYMVDSKSSIEKSSEGDCAAIQRDFFQIVDPSYPKIEDSSGTAADKNTQGGCDEIFGHLKEGQTNLAENRNTPACEAGNEYHGGMPRPQTQRELTNAPNVYQNKHDSQRSDESEKEGKGNGEGSNRKNGSLHLNNLFWGRSNFKRFLMICVCLVSSLGAVSAAPSFFDEYGRSHLSPLNCGCTGSGSKRARVVGGSELEEGSAPWLAAITKGGRSHCGATLVTVNHLLSAAHCIDGVHLGDLRGWLGVHALSDAQNNAKGRKFRSAYPHPQFQMNGFHNDIAILEFQHSVQFTSTIRPACIPARADEEYASRTAVVAGWGKTGERDPPSDVPRQALVQVWARSKCKSAGYPAKKVAGEVLCAGLAKGGVDACQGDSGGPLVMEGPNGATEIIGVVSWGRGCARPNLPGIYTRVASYLPFLHSILASSC